jgi:hypothetical protein
MEIQKVKKGVICKMQNRNDSKGDLEAAILAIVLAITTISSAGLAARYYSPKMDKKNIEYKQQDSYRNSLFKIND